MSEVVKVSEPGSGLNVPKILSLCRFFRVRSWMDSLWMTEVGIGGGIVDMMVIDLRTHLTFGYEVKTSRADFVADTKWCSYTPFFNYFYFATPPGIISPTELPDEIGLVEARPVAGETGESRLIQLKRARLIQPRFTRQTLGENHLIKILLAYMRDFNWRQATRNFGAVCPGCGCLMKVRDPRGLPFGHIAEPGANPE